MCSHINWIPVSWALQSFESSQHPEPPSWPPFFPHLLKVFLQWNESFPLWQDTVCWFDSCSHGSFGVVSVHNSERGFCCCQLSRIFETCFLHTSALTLFPQSWITGEKFALLYLGKFGLLLKLGLTLVLMKPEWQVGLLWKVSLDFR